MTIAGKVYIVGAGPGDPKLLTLRGRECLERADVVIYDRLVSPRILRYVKPSAELVYVGKEPGNHTLDQSEINELLVREAKLGRIVVRLKGGDPFVFGRGGEEADVLYEQGVEFEVVPGITSAIAVPAYAGIPVTYRGLSQSFAVVTGHGEATKKAVDIDWSTLAMATGTLVFLMGVAQLPDIVSQLTSHGRSPDTPVALVRWGTRAEQETLVGTLSTIVDQVARREFQPPAVTIVGEVVRVRERLAWYERKPLFGRRVIVTRATGQASELASMIEELGGESLEYPLIEIVPPGDWTAFDEALQSGAFDWLVFSSQNAVEHTFRRMRALRRDVRTWAGTRIAAVGRSTVEAVEATGLLVDLVPTEYRSASLAPLLQERIQPGARILWPRGDQADEAFAHSLQAFGAQVVDPIVYENRPQADRAALLRDLSSGRVDAITFASSSTVKNFLACLGCEHASEAADMLSKVSIVCIGPSTEAAALQCGFRVDRVAQDATVRGLVTAVVEELASGSRTKGD